MYLKSTGNKQKTINKFFVVGILSAPTKEQDPDPNP